MGFGIYINCRTEVEGWDIQLLFQKFSGEGNNTKHDEGKKSGKGSVVFLSVLIFCFTFFSPVLYAQEETNQALTEQEDGEEKSEVNLPHDFFPVESIPHEKLKEILSSDDFGGTKPGWSIRFKNTREPTPLPNIDFPEWLEKLKEFLAFGLRAFVVLIVAALAVFAAVKYLKLRPDKKTGKNKNFNFFANKTEESENPETNFKNAEEYFRKNHSREAWACCLNGTINSFSIYFGLIFPPDSTEYGCLEIVKNSFSNALEKNPAEEFNQLVKHWVFLAYGGMNPPQGSFEKALNFGRSLKDREPELQNSSTADTLYGV